MKKFRYSLQKGFGNQRKEKVIIISAADSIAAAKKIETDFPDWEVSMFWPIYEKKRKEILWTPWGMKEYIF